MLNYVDTTTAGFFHLDDSPVRLLFGPLGCGKSVAGCIEILGRAIRQAPGIDNIRRSRWGVVRNTYPELKSTTLKTWQAWYPPEKFGPIKWDSPITHKIRFPLPDGSQVDCEVIFLALDSEADISKLKSFEFTGIYINEMQYVPKVIFDECRKRINRYPSKKDGAEITWAGIIADTNPPDTDHWIYKVFEEERPEGYKIFKYTPALIKVESQLEISAQSTAGTWYANNPACDYHHVQNDIYYWLKFVPGSSDEAIKVDALGDYGIVIHGKPVHSTYNDNFHFANKEILSNPLVTIGLGWDFGLTPACVIVQMSPRGQLIVLDELCTEDMGLRDFASSVVIPHLNMRYPHWQQNYISRHDPAGNANSQTDGNNCLMILSELGIKSVEAAPNNAPTPRRDSLKYFLGKMVDGEPAFILSNRCKMLRKGLMGRYQYARIRVTGDEKYHDVPLKNMYSHPCEALEYIAMHYSSEIRRPTPQVDTAAQYAASFNRLNRLRTEAYGSGSTRTSR